MKPPLRIPFIFASAFLLTVHGAEVDRNFSSPLQAGIVQALALSPDGDLVAGGDFSARDGSRSLVRLSPRGDLQVSPSVGEQSVHALALTPDGQLVIAGSRSIISVNRFDAPVSQGRVKALAVTPSGLIVIGGSFWSQPDIFVSALTDAGAKSASFNSSLQLNFAMEAGVDVLSVQPDGKILVGGNFNTDAGFGYLARLNGDGSVDRSFSREHGPILYPKALCILADGKILVAGVADSSGRGFVRRLNVDGTVDNTFIEANANYAVHAFAFDSVGRIILGGVFTDVNGVSCERLARLERDGQLDPSWTLGANNVVTALATDQQGRVLVGGAFTEIGGVERTALARIVEGTPLAFRALAVSGSGHMNLSLACSAGKKYVIEYSADLKSWSEFKAETATTQGLDLSANIGQGARGFFRARAIAP